MPSRCAFLLHHDEAVKVRIGMKRGNEQNHAINNWEKKTKCSTGVGKELKVFGSRNSKKEDGKMFITTTDSKEDEEIPHTPTITTTSTTGTSLYHSEELPTSTLSSSSSASSVSVLSQHPVQLGVKLIWVASRCRRKGIARRLLDSARKNFVFGSVVPITSIAFSQPSEEGFAFAKGYCGGNNVLAYG